MGLPQTNRLLDALQAEHGAAAFLAEFEHVPMPVGTVLYATEESPRYVHFMTSGLASIVTTMSGGDAMEVGLVGREGFPESLYLLGPERSTAHCFMQVEGTALRMGFQRFKEEFHRNPALHKLVLRYIQYESMSLSQLSACNRLHEVEERLARLLLMVEDRTGDPNIKLTQEFLGYMLGTRRSSVTMVAGSLQRSGLIEYRRGNVKIVDRAGLEESTCECYLAVQRMFHNLYRLNN